MPLGANPTRNDRTDDACREQDLATVATSLEIPMNRAVCGSDGRSDAGRP
jgi:hypothetical protein